MVKNVKVILWSALLLMLGLVVGANSSYAANFQSASDLISTSRPSASAPLSANQAGASTVSTITTVDNGSIFLASDSANFAPDTGETGDYGLNVATMSSQLAGPTRQISLTSLIPHAHHLGDAVYVPITAMHKIQVKINTALVSGNHLIIIFPGGGSNLASPSATTFSFNGLTSTQIQTNGFTCSSWTINAPSIDCTLNSSLTSGATATFLIGCTTPSGANCSVQNPLLINPTKSATLTCNTNSITCTADQWKVIIKSQIGGIDQDVSQVKIGVIESVQVSASVEPSLTFTITGIANSSNLSAVPGCNSESPSSGVDSTATNVNLGTLVNNAINLSEQKISVSTNGSTGYVLTATSSGRFIDAQLGFWLPDADGGNGLTANDTSAVGGPATFGASGTPDFGINACGTNANLVNSGQWAGASATSFSGGAKYMNPWNTSGNFFYSTLSSAIGAVTNDLTGIRYAATVSGTTPAGTYTTTLTFVATATF